MFSGVLGHPDTIVFCEGLLDDQQCLILWDRASSIPIAA